MIRYLWIAVKYLIVGWMVLFVWDNRDRLPAQYQFWTPLESVVRVHNRADQDLRDVTITVGSSTHSLGTIAPGASRLLNVGPRAGGSSVILRFQFGRDREQRDLGLLESKGGLAAYVGYAGVVRVERASREEVQNAGP